MNKVPITLGELFTFPSIRGITEQYCRLNPGNIPVYGGRKTDTPIGYIKDNLTGVKYFENCLAWNRQGSVGYVFYHNHRFTTTDDHRPMYLNDEYVEKVDLEYLQSQVQSALLSSGFAWGKTAGKEKIKDIYIDLPADDNGNISLLKQRELINRYHPIALIHKRLNEYREILINAQIRANCTYNCKELFLSDEDVFILDIGRRQLKKDLFEDGIPVFSANVLKPLGFSTQTSLKTLEYDSLIWGIDGNFNWAYIPKNSIFDITDHCGRLQVKSSAILCEYLYYKLRESSNSYGFNRTYRASLENIKSVSVDVPIKSDGVFDVCAQQELIIKYREIDSLKFNLLKMIDDAIRPQVE